MGRKVVEERGREIEGKSERERETGRQSKRDADRKI